MEPLNVRLWLTNGETRDLQIELYEKPEWNCGMAFKIPGQKRDVSTIAQAIARADMWDNLPDDVKYDKWEVI